MKFFTVLLAATAATALAQTTTAPPAAAGAAEACIAQLAPLLQDPVLKECTTESGLVFPPTAAPTEDVVKKACASKSCGALVAKVKGLGVASCKITGGIDIIGQVLEPIAKECKFDGKAAGNGTEPAKPEGCRPVPRLVRAREPRTRSRPLLPVRRLAVMPRHRRRRAACRLPRRPRRRVLRASRWPLVRLSSPLLPLSCKQQLRSCRIACLRQGECSACRRHILF
ncbi:hypothetical protein PINS_up010397 [Pythium insidiosum]|nr:hypothetical protein PINS_up010397 [Pythium insidiosum]